MSRRLTQKQKRELNKVARNHWKTILAILLIIVVFFVVAYYLGWIDLFINKFFPKDDDGDDEIHITSEVKIK